MDSKILVQAFVVIFSVVITIFFQKYYTSTDTAAENGVAIEILRNYPGIACPSNFTLYRLTDAHDVYAIQTIRTETDKIVLKRCEISPFTWTEAALLPVIHGITRVVNNTEEAILKQACHEVTYLTESGQEVEEMHDEVEVPVEEYEDHLIMNLDDLNETLEEIETTHYEGWTEEEKGALWSISHAIYPGTLWCGMDNMAGDHYNRLGREAEADACCRAHDHCKPLIEPYKTRYHQENPTVLPYSHCSCDIEFYNCMKRAGTATAREIARIFFNLTKMKCFDFELKEVCIPGWFRWWCSESKETCAAVVRENPTF